MFFEEIKTTETCQLVSQYLQEIVDSLLLFKKTAGLFPNVIQDHKAKFPFVF